MEIKETELIEAIALSFLIEPLPDNWVDMPEDELYEWVENNCNVMYEHFDGKTLFEEIDSCTKAVLQFIKTHRMNRY